jgi:hypothetical protein
LTGNGMDCLQTTVEAGFGAVKFCSVEVPGPENVSWISLLAAVDDSC